VSQPNIILITTDQQRADTINAAGADWMITPNLDRLAAEGTLFTNAFCCAATCISSRSVLYTGLYPHTTGVYGFYTYRGRLNWTHRLRDQGYETVSIGKTHIDGGSHGFDQRIADQGNKCSPGYWDDDEKETRLKSLWLEELEAAGFKPPVDRHKSDPDYWDKLVAVEWTLPEEWHFDVWMGNKVVEWVDSHESADKPLFLHVGFLGPHDLYDPPQRYIDSYEDDSIPMPNVTEEERSGMPDELWAENRRLSTSFGNDTVIHPERATPDRVRKMRKHYFANVTVIDEQVGHIIDALERKGLLENSLLIFTSDHGDNLLDHDLVYKGELYDTIVNIPMIIRDYSSDLHGQVVTSVTSQLDMVQYLLEKAGAEREDLNGISLQPVVEAGRPHSRQYVYAEEGATGLRPEPDLCAMIRSHTAKLIMFVGGSTGQLFDLENDPGETRNLWSEPEAQELKAELTYELLTWLYKDLHRNSDRLDPLR
jgi:arylsulfatase